MNTVRQAWEQWARDWTAYERDGLRLEMSGPPRPISACLDALERAGVLVQALREHDVPSGVSPHAHPWQRIPHFRHGRARRP